MDLSKSPSTSPVERQLPASGPSPADVQAAEDDARGFNLPGVVPVLELDAATPRALTAFSVWAWRRLTVKPSIIEIPTPSLVELEELHDDVWDAAYLLQVVSGVEKATQDLQDFRFARECLALAASRRGRTCFRASLCSSCGARCGCHRGLSRLCSAG
jgi:hypothetical protein